MKTVAKTTQITVITVPNEQEDFPIYTENSIVINVLDEGAGEFISLTRGNRGDIRIDKEEWPTFRKVIDKLFSMME